ncbi:hypothetical protein QQG74_10080 [Micromonospora sp. FIMYZ51]|uniref:AbiTii domain-containing protein n=1 Tax=Micromonospora sp. FIMYZ51 TaxID=3051832 RepID=UPI00311E823D
MLKKQTEALKLAEDLLADIELSRVDAENLLLKASRLARLIGDEDSLQWLQLELNGYTFNQSTRPHLKRSGRIYKNEKGEERAKVRSFGAIASNIKSLEGMLSTLHTPSLSGEHLSLALNAHYRNVGQVTNSIAELSAIRSAVIANLYEVATRTYHELLFSESQGELFESTRQHVDSMLAPLSGTALTKVESIIERLDAGDPEAISQAMSTCRRLIDSFADAVFPPQEEPIQHGEQKVDVRKSNVLNRIDAFVRQCTSSKSRQGRLRQAMRGIYDRVSTGIHNDVTLSEARFLFLETYVLLGEILSLKTPSPTQIS